MAMTMDRPLPRSRSSRPSDREKDLGTWRHLGNCPQLESEDGPGACPRAESSCRCRQGLLPMRGFALPGVFGSLGSALWHSAAAGLDVRSVLHGSHLLYDVHLITRWPEETGLTRRGTGTRSMTGHPLIERSVGCQWGTGRGQRCLTRSSFGDCRRSHGRPNAISAAFARHETKGTIIGGQVILIDKVRTLDKLTMLLWEAIRVTEVRRTYPTPRPASSGKACRDIPPCVAVAGVTYEP